MGLISSFTDAAGNVLDYLGDNLENNQNAQTAIVERERAITKIELQRAEAQEKRNQEAMKMAGKVLTFLGAITVIIVIARFVIPAIRK